MPADRRRALGAAGEDAAAAWYTAAGYRIVERNWRCREGELDIVAERAGVLVFCEVKTRTTDRFGAPVEAITRTKQARIRRLASRWLQEHAVRAPSLRFDVASVMPGSDGRPAVEMIEAAF